MEGNFLTKSSSDSDGLKELVASKSHVMRYAILDSSANALRGDLGLVLFRRRRISHDSLQDRRQS